MRKYHKVNIVWIKLIYTKKLYWQSIKTFLALLKILKMQNCLPSLLIFSGEFTNDSAISQTSLASRCDNCRKHETAAFRKSR